jgi:hypothetical protein
VKQIYWIGALLAASILAPGFLLGQSRPQVAYPEGYRGWERVKSVVILEGHEHYEAFGGFHHVYANEQAVAALKEQMRFPNGSVLVFELFETITDNNSERFGETESWGFEDFKQADPHQRSVTDMRAQCLFCHATQKATDYVYTTYRQ